MTSWQDLAYHVKSSSSNNTVTHWEIIRREVKEEPYVKGDQGVINERVYTCSYGTGVTLAS